MIMNTSTSNCRHMAPNLNAALVCAASDHERSLHAPLVTPRVCDNPVPVETHEVCNTKAVLKLGVLSAKHALCNTAAVLMSAGVRTSRPCPSRRSLHFGRQMQHTIGHENATMVKAPSIARCRRVASETCGCQSRTKQLDGVVAGQISRVHVKSVTQCL